MAFRGKHDCIYWHMLTILTRCRTRLHFAKFDSMVLALLIANNMLHKQALNPTSDLPEADDSV